MRRLGVYLWAGPATAIGAVLSVFFDRRSIVRGVIVAEGARWPKRLGWRYRAITFGHSVLSVDELDEATLTHEFVHVRQFERWGPLLLIAYPLASLWVKLRGGHAYLDNPFEIEARSNSRSATP